RLARRAFEGLRRVGERLLGRPVVGRLEGGRPRVEAVPCLGGRVRRIALGAGRRRASSFRLGPLARLLRSLLGTSALALRFRLASLLLFLEGLLLRGARLCLALRTRP